MGERSGGQGALLLHGTRFSSGSECRVGRTVRDRRLTKNRVFKSEGGPASGSRTGNVRPREAQKDPWRGNELDHRRGPGPLSLASSTALWDCEKRGVQAETEWSHLCGRHQIVAIVTSDSNSQRLRSMTPSKIWLGGGMRSPKVVTLECFRRGC